MKCLFNFFIFKVVDDKILSFTKEFSSENSYIVEEYEFESVLQHMKCPYKSFRIFCYERFMIYVVLVELVTHILIDLKTSIYRTYTDISGIS
jgi:hypothetical protein